MTSTEVDAWLKDAVTAVEWSITGLLQDFLSDPYAHRVEHSLHVDLYRRMLTCAALSTSVPIGGSGYNTRLVHKEWPSAETASLRGGSPRRQSFDLAVVDPVDVQAGTLSEFTEGRFVAPIAIELGLDYNSTHIAGDLTKLENNKVQHGYVVHLTRKRTRNADAVLESVLAASKVKVAFAQLDPSERRFQWKGLDDTEVREHRLPDFGGYAAPVD